MKGIILAGGKGTRLYPITIATSKQLLPVYDKPMIFYPLTTLRLAGIDEILIISDPQNLPRIKSLFDVAIPDFKLWFATQNEPKGILESLIIGKEFIGDSDVCLILGDNIFYGPGFQHGILGRARDIVEKSGGVNLFGKQVADMGRFGIYQGDDQLYPRIVEKPDVNSISENSLALLGLYMYPNWAISHINKIKPSKRGELEITDFNQYLYEYCKLNTIPFNVTNLGRGFTWFDAGTFKSLNNASNFIRITQENTGFEIGNPFKINVQ